MINTSLLKRRLAQITKQCDAYLATQLVLEEETASSTLPDDPQLELSGGQQ